VSCHVARIQATRSTACGPEFLVPLVGKSQRRQGRIYTARLLSKLDIVSGEVLGRQYAATSTLVVVGELLNWLRTLELDVGTPQGFLRCELLRSLLRASNAVKHLHSTQFSIGY